MPKKKTQKSAGHGSVSSGMSGLPSAGRPSVSQHSTDNRKGKRYLYKHHVDVTYGQQDWPAEILDWSKDGIQVVINSSIDVQISDEIEFHIHRMSFIDEEEFEGENEMLPVEEWHRNGWVKWNKDLTGSTAIGIEFEKSLEGLPLPELPSYITEADLCHLLINSKK